MTQDERLQLISESINEINISLAVLIKRFDIVDTRGCLAAMDKISEIEDEKIKPLEKKLEKNFREHSFMRGIIYFLALASSIILYLLEKGG